MPTHGSHAIQYSGTNHATASRGASIPTDGALKLSGTAPMVGAATEEGAALLSAAMALREELLRAAQSQAERATVSGRRDPFGTIRGRTSLEQACADVHALLRCLDDELLRRHQFPQSQS